MTKALSKTRFHQIVTMGQEIQELNKKGLRNFAWMFAAVVISLFGLILPWLLNRDWPWQPWVVAIVFIAWGLVAPGTLRPFYRFWMRLGFLMNAIMTRIILGVVFYVAILPYGLIFRFLKIDPLNRKLNHQLSSYRVKSQKINSKQMEKPF